MKSVLIGLALAAVLAVVAAVVFNVQDYSAESSFTSESGSVRLGD
jgi:hypothetical protein